MLPLLVIGLALGTVPGEGDPEPVGYLLSADIGSLPHALVELEAPLSPWGSVFFSMGAPVPVGVGISARLPGPQVAAGARTYVFGRGPWGLFLDGRLLANVYYPTDTHQPLSGPAITAGGGITVGLNAKLWHALVSPGISLFYVPDPDASSAFFPALRLAVGGWAQDLLLGAVPEEGEEEPVAWILTADLGSLPRAALELEAPMMPTGSAFISLGYPLSIGLNLSGRIPGPQVAAGWRVYLFGRGPWGMFADGRLLANMYFPADPMAPSPIIISGGGLTVGLNVKVWHLVVSPGLSLFYAPDPTVSSAILPALRLAVGGWN